MPKSFPLTRIIPLILILIPPVFVLYLISQAGEIPHFDYWWIIARFYSPEGFSTNWQDWLFRNNEHLLLIPSLVYSLNIFLTKGSNIGLSLFAFSFAFIQSFILIALIPPTVKKSPILNNLALISIFLLNFTPAAAHNWMRGFSGVIWMGANLFVIAALFCLYQFSRAWKAQQITAQNIFNPWSLSTIGFGILATLNYSTSLGFWGILSLVALLLRFPKRLIALYWGLSALVLGLYFLTYETPPHHPSLSQNSPLKTLEYIPVYLGGIFTTEVNAALILGVVGLLVGCLVLLNFIIETWSRNNTELYQLPWLCIWLYILGTAVMAAVSRSGFGIEQAFSSRYASLPALFWLSIILMGVTGLASKTKLQQWRSLFPWLIAAMILVIGMYRVGYSVMSQQIRPRAVLQPLVALSLQLDAPDSSLVKAVIGNRPQAFLKMVPALKANQLVPFTRDITQNNPCIPLESVINPDQLANSTPDVKGSWDTLTPLSPIAAVEQEIEDLEEFSPLQSPTPILNDTVAAVPQSGAQVMGWAGTATPNELGCIAILNQDRVVRGFGLLGFPRPDVVKVMGEAYQQSGWKGYIRLVSSDRTLNAYLFSKPLNQWVLLPSTAAWPPR